MELSSHHGQEIGTFVIFLIFLKTPQRPSLPNVKIIICLLSPQKLVLRLWEHVCFDNLRSPKVWILWGRSEIYIIWVTLETTVDWDFCKQCNATVLNYNSCQHLSQPKLQAPQILDSLKCSQPYSHTCQIVWIKCFQKSQFQNLRWEKGEEV